MRPQKGSYQRNNYLTLGNEDEKHINIFNINVSNV